MNKTMKVFGALILAVAVMFASQAQAATDMLQIKGSDTLINLVQRLAEEYMEDNPGSYVAVTGGGSGTGIAALLNGTTDIAATSRKIKDKEISLASQKGLEPTEIVVARDGIAVVVNPANPISELSIEQLEKIFTGAVNNWSAVGGKATRSAPWSRRTPP